MVRRFCEDSLNDAFCQFAGALILFFHDPDAKSGSYVRAILTVHSTRYFFVIFITTRFVESEA